jgi:predicted deacylase
MKKTLENRISEASRSVEPSQNFSEGLWRKIQNSPQPIPAHRRAPRWRWIPATAIETGLVIALLVVSPQQVWASLRGLFDFLPGIGLVQDDQSTLYLTKPSA